MRKLLILIAAAAAVVGCGGNGSNPPAFPYSGTWVGTWESPDLEQDGAATFNIAANGEVTGTIVNDAIEMEGDVDGTISNNGVVSGTVTYPDLPPMTITGAVSFNEAGHLVGTLDQNVGEGTVDVVIDVARQ